jgi:hypothetical protein
MTAESADVIWQKLELNRQERARLATNKPFGWTTKYDELQRQGTELALQWQEAESRETMDEWWLS